MTQPVRPLISIVVAVAHDGAIGRRGDLIARLRPDMRHFRALTMGHPIVMGRRTFESFPNGPLPGRRNIVISRNPAYPANGADVYPSLDTALLSTACETDEVMVIGGGQIYRQAIDKADRIYLTQIDTTAPDADTYFPPIDSQVWRSDDVGDWQIDPDTRLRYRFICLNRR